MRTRVHHLILMLPCLLGVGCGGSQPNADQPAGQCQYGAQGRTCTDGNGYLLRDTTEEKVEPTRDEPRRQITPR